MAEKTEVASMRVTRGTLAKLRMVAHKLSLERRTDVTWYGLVMELINQHLLECDAEKPRDGRRRCRPRSGR